MKLIQVRNYYKKGIELFHSLNYDCFGTQKESMLFE